MRRLRISPRVTTALALVSVSLLGLARVGAVPAKDPERPIRALLVLGGCCHDYAKQKDILTKGISARANVTWTIAYDPDTTTKHKNPVYDNADWAKGFDVIVHDECSSDVKDMDVIDRILKPHRDGLPAVVLHCGMHCYRSEGCPKTITPWFEFTGLQTTGHGPQLPIAIRFVDTGNPITKGLADWTTINEELYNNITGKLLDTGHALAGGKQPIKNATARTTDDTIVAWTNTYNGKTTRLRHDARPQQRHRRRRPLSRPGHPRPAVVRRQARRRPPATRQDRAHRRLIQKGDILLFRKSRMSPFPRRERRSPTSARRASAHSRRAACRRRCSGTSRHRPDHIRWPRRAAASRKRKSANARIARSGVAPSSCGSFEPALGQLGLQLADHVADHGAIRADGVESSGRWSSRCRPPDSPVAVRVHSSIFPCTRCGLSPAAKCSGKSK